MANLPRVIFSLKPEMLAEIDDLQKRLNLDSRAAVIRWAIRKLAKETPK